jgi:cell wall-associated NlpC family hydrolase
MLIGRIYIEAGILPSDFAIPEGDPGWARAHKTSLIEPFIDACKHFQGLSGKSDIQPGDLLGFRIEGCLHHIGIVLTENRFVHCLRGQGVQYSRLDDATFMPRLMRVWRPV